jgi:hypothetical protein
MTGSWKLYTPSVLMPNLTCLTNGSAYFQTITQFLSTEQLEEIATEVDSIGNAPLNVSSYGVQASINTLRLMAFACLALDSGARSFLEIGSGYGAFAFILHRVAFALDIPIRKFTACDIPDAQLVQAAYLDPLKKIASLEYLSTTLCGADFVGPVDMLFSAYGLSELDVLTRSTFLKNLLPKCKKGFLVWSSPDVTGIPEHATISPEDPSTGRMTNFVTWNSA